MRLESFAQIPLRELDVIYQIAELAADVYRDEDEGGNRFHSEVTRKCDPVVEALFDIATCHAFCCPLRLCDLRDARADHFVHDVRGIRRFLDPKKRVLRDGFLPLHAAALEATR
jgi:hypothetical protein